MSDVTAKTYVSKKERWSFGVAALGQGMVYAIMSSYISDFYINVMGVDLLFVLLLMLFARVWDAINDPIMGIIVDKTETRFGKLRPYILATALPIAALSCLLFVDFGLDNTGKMIYAGFVYVFWGMTYTVSDIPFWSMPNLMTPNPNERANTISFGRTMNGIGSAVPIAIFTLLGFVLPALSSKQGVELDKSKYFIMAIISSIVGVALFINSYFQVKERVSIPKKVRKPGEPRTLSRIFGCRPLMLVVIMGILSAGRYMNQVASIHVARYAFYIGPDLATVDNPTAALQSSITIVNTILTVCSAVGMFGSMLLMPKLYKKFNYKQIVIVSCFAGFLAGLVTTLFGALSIVNNSGALFYACIPFIIIQCIPLGVLNVTGYAMIGDCLDYMEWKTGFRDNALGSACQSFVNKLGNAFATVIIIAMYMAINLNPTDIYAGDAVVIATDLAVGQRLAMFSLVSLVPGISLLACAIPIFFYDLVGEKKNTITKELNERRQAADAALPE